MPPPPRLSARRSKALAGRQSAGAVDSAAIARFGAKLPHSAGAESRDAEGRRGKLYEVLETHGKAALGIADMAPRLRELNEQVKRLEAALVAIEDEQEPLVPRLAASAEEAARVMREMVLGCENPRTVRDLAASIIDHIEVGPTEIRVDYHPECLIRDGGALVHSTRNWLPDLGSNQGPTD